MCGPFNFPEGTKLISPILWLCLLEEAAMLRKPLKIVLLHCLSGDVDQDGIGPVIVITKLMTAAKSLTTSGHLSLIKCSFTEKIKAMALLLLTISVICASVHPIVK